MYNLPNICLALRVKKNNKMVGFIGGLIEKTQINSQVIDVLNVNIFCVYQKLRTKNIATTLIKEMINKANNNNLRQGFFVTERYLPHPISSITNYVRPLNYNRLVELKYMQPSKDKSGNICKTTDMIKYYALNHTLDNKFIKLTPEQIPIIYEIYNEYMEKYNLWTRYSFEEFKTILTNKTVKTYVAINESGNPVDFISYYQFQYLTKDDQILNAGKLFLYTSVKTPPYYLMKNALIAAKNDGLDLFSSLNCLENDSVLNELKFLTTENQQHYYIYGNNESLISMEGKQIAKINII